MIFAVPVIGRVLAGLAASEVTNAAATETTRAASRTQSAEAADPAAFASALDKIEHSAGPNLPFATGAPQ